MGIGDEAYKRPWTPMDDVMQRQDNGFGMLPQAAMQAQQLQMQKQQMAAQQAEQDHQNAPIDPWQEALRDLQAGELDIKDIAARTKSRLGGGVQGAGQPMPNESGMQRPDGNMGIGGQPRMQSVGSSMDGAAVQMPQGIGSGMQGQSMQGQPQPQTNRSYNDFMTKAQPLAARRSSEKTAAMNVEQRDRATTAKQNIEWAKMDAKTLAQDLDREVKMDNLTEKHRHNIASIELGYARLRNQMNKWNSVSPKEKYEILKDLTKEIGQIRHSIDELSKDPASMLANSKVFEYVEANKEKLRGLEELHNTLRDSLTTQPTGVEIKSGESTSEPAGVQAPTQATQAQPQTKTTTNKTPAGQRKFKVGDKVKSGGAVKTVKAVDSNGKIVKLE